MSTCVFDCVLSARVELQTQWQRQTQHVHSHPVNWSCVVGWEQKPVTFFFCLTLLLLLFFNQLFCAPIFSVAGQYSLGHWPQKLILSGPTQGQRVSALFIPQLPPTLMWPTPNSSLFKKKKKNREVWKISPLQLHSLDDSGTLSWSLLYQCLLEY